MNNRRNSDRVPDFRRECFPKIERRVIDLPFLGCISVLSITISDEFSKHFVFAKAGHTTIFLKTLGIFLFGINDIAAISNPS
jgi:hypothetical protein